MEDNFVIFALLILGIWYLIYRVLASTKYGFFPRRARVKSEFHGSKLVGVLMNLDDKAVDELLRLYKTEFGAGPARYAKKTFRKWKTGEVQPATQTFDRFLLRLPQVMSYDLKCEVLRHFMEEYAAKAHYTLDVYTDNWQEKLDPLVRQIIDKALQAQLPAPLESQLRWLGNGDMQAAQALLRRSQAEEGRIMVSMLRDEFANIERLLAEEHLKPRVNHMLEFPYGTIELNIRRR